MEQKPGKPNKSETELLNELEQIEDAILELVNALLAGQAGLSGELKQKVEQLHEEHFQLEQKIHRGEIDLEEAIKGSKDILKKLEIFAS